ncbi:MAG: hypothetical protein M3017_15260 [Actinomycetota bacterium]|nr:hypothetical protein [Actinomycetota bacterium]
MAGNLAGQPQGIPTGNEYADTAHTAPSRGLDLGVRRDIIGLYGGLGGLREAADFPTGQWDIACGGLLIYLGEDLRFNQFWAGTLTAGPVHSRTPGSRLGHTGHVFGMNHAPIIVMRLVPDALREFIADCADS